METTRLRNYDDCPGEWDAMDETEVNSRVRIGSPDKYLLRNVNCIIVHSCLLQNLFLICNIVTLVRVNISVLISLSS